MTETVNNNHHDVTSWDLLTVPETARILRISRNLAYELVARDEIPAIRLGRVIRVPRHGLQVWLDRQIDTDRARSGPSPSPG